MPWGRAGSRATSAGLLDRSLTLDRDGVAVAVTARIDVHGGGTELPIKAEGSGLARSTVTVFLAADADIKKDDSFYLSDQDAQYRVLYVEEPVDVDGSAAYTAAYCEVYQP